MDETKLWEANGEKQSPISVIFRQPCLRQFSANGRNYNLTELFIEIFYDCFAAGADLQLFVDMA